MSSHTAPQQKPILYAYFRSSCSWRVRIALAVKGIEYELRPVQIVQGEQRKDEYLALNPGGKVPTLVIPPESGSNHPPVAIHQSTAILEYLEEAYPDHTPMLPKTPVDRARVRAIMGLVAEDIQPLQNLSILQHFHDRPEDKAQWIEQYVGKGLEAVETILKNTAGTYAFGDTVSMADALIIPQCHSARRFNLDMNRFPTILRVEAAASALPSFQAASYQAQPDCPEELR
ncbi:glutathione S-transferase [Piptocephalis cylindrospora]|uniref:Glutathione S-transferase n=1 Tax=Piptocephalis cylindrospora TaxID=1907219 RepID=A0A4P9Y3P5_9FUNG|nr:glutathione S-transferase [Piptocephalis cylindrospora]|eukprot:RKP13578.1 glutathione S-transferase [Piptocephalis cylindrospora]